ncbi:MAG: hypothetical protein KatS3mg078_1376 [Deltaproteobacteria bacterium]|jgi:hypothetical protein|nr:MAG: hypothetical protein KatS3mg078_1376 [Deltaproteobacteria bacterium]
MSELIGEGKAKGSIFAHAKEYINRTHGTGIWKEILGYLTEKDREFWEGSFNKTEWYPTPLLNRLIRIYDKLIGSGDFKSIEPVAEYIAEQDLSPVFDIFINLKNPVFILNSAPSLWSRYFNTGTVKIEISDEKNNYYRFSLKELADDNLVSSRAICTWGVPTWLKKALLMAGAKEVIAKHTRCRYEGSNECVLEVWWK